MYLKNWICGCAAFLAAGVSIYSINPAMAQQGPAGCAWNKYLYAQDAVKQGNMDTNLLNQMSNLVAAQGFSLTNKVWQVCNGWLMDAKRADGSIALLYVEPKTNTIVDIDFTK